MDHLGLSVVIEQLRYRWPMVVAWIDNQPGELIDTWQDTLRSVPEQNAVEILQHWHRVGAPFTHDSKLWQDIPSMILREYNKGQQTGDVVVYAKKRARDNNSNLAEVLERIRRTNNPELRQAIIDEAVSKFPPDDPDSLPRYRCWKCLDTGMVVLFLNWTDTAGAYCGECQEGKLRHTQQKQSDRMIQLYDPRKHPWHIVANADQVREHIIAWLGLTQSQRYQLYTGKKLLLEHTELSGDTW